MTTPWGVPALLEDAQVKAALDRFGDDWRTDDEKRSASALVTALLRALGTGEGDVMKAANTAAFAVFKRYSNVIPYNTICEAVETAAAPILTAPLRARIALLEAERDQAKAELFAETQGRELLADCEARLATVTAALVKYAEHAPHCTYGYSHHRECSCGLTQLLASPAPERSAT